MSVFRHIISLSRPIISSRISAHKICCISTRSKYRAVIFDMGGVVLPSPFPMAKEYERLKNIPSGTIQQAIIQYGKKGAWPKLEVGQIDAVEFGDLFSAECSHVINQDINVGDFLHYLEEHMKEPIPEVLDAIQCLRQYGYKTALLTNNWKTASGKTYLPLDHSIFDVVVESAVAGINKPSHIIYKLCLNKLGTSAEDTVFLDDMDANICAAKSLDIHSIKVDDVHEAISELEGLLGVLLDSTSKGTRPIKEDMQFPVQNLFDYLNSEVGLNLSCPPEVRQFSHGQSNPTYLINPGPNSKKYVLRKKPPGKLLPSAHAVEREFRVMNALSKNKVPIPPLLALCEDTNVLGTPFYLMEFVSGNIYKNPSLPGMSPDKRRMAYQNMIKTLSSIHKVDIDQAGLNDYGKKGNYVARQVKTWSKQYKLSETHNIPSMERLMTWLPEHLPSHEATTVVHGDFRIDNLIYRRDTPDVLAVLDWELSTLGDPISDLAYSCLQFHLPQNFPIISGLKGLNLKELGIPTQDEMVEEYCKEMGIDKVINLDFYLAFSFFRIAAILQGVYKRSKQGQASSAKAEQAGKLAENMANLAWDFASKEGFRLFSKVNPSLLGKNTNPSSDKKRYYSTSSSAGVTSMLPLDLKSLRPEVQDLHSKLLQFMEEHVYPVEQELRNHSSSDTRWNPHPLIEELKNKAKSLSLWNLFLPAESDPSGSYGAGLTNVEYAYLCEVMGRSIYAPEMFNCSAPDTGNMEILAEFGTEEQKEKFLRPLLNGEIRSCFAMTEPQVASSDATNISSSIVEDGDHLVLNGRKWWTSGAMDPRMEVIIFMGKNDPQAPRHNQQSMVIVPTNTPGVSIVRPLTVFGYDDAPVGHGEVTFENVRVPKTNVILGLGRGFEIAQARLGPGRIHHCMRLIGHAERSLELMKERVSHRVTFGRPLVERDTIMRDIATSRIEIEQCRLLVLKTALMMDVVGKKAAAKEIAMIKIVVPRTMGGVIDRSMQAFGAAGLSGDFPLATFYAWSRALRIADGPDEVHERALARLELSQ